MLFALALLFANYCDALHLKPNLPPTIGSHNIRRIEGDQNGHRPWWSYNQDRVAGWRRWPPVGRRAEVVHPQLYESEVSHPNVGMSRIGGGVVEEETEEGEIIEIQPDRLHVDAPGQVNISPIRPAGRIRKNSQLSPLDVGLGIDGDIETGQGQPRNSFPDGLDESAAPNLHSHVVQRPPRLDTSIPAPRIEDVFPYSPPHPVNADPNILAHSLEAAMSSADLLFHFSDRLILQQAASDVFLAAVKFGAAKANVQEDDPTLEIEFSFDDSRAIGRFDEWDSPFTVQTRFTERDSVSSVTHESGSVDVPVRDLSAFRMVWIEFIGAMRAERETVGTDVVEIDHGRIWDITGPAESPTLFLRLQYKCECSICCSPLQKPKPNTPHKPLIILPCFLHKCSGSVYHTACFDEYILREFYQKNSLNQEFSCPVCRLNICDMAEQRLLDLGVLTPAYRKSPQQLSIDSAQAEELDLSDAEDVDSDVDMDDALANECESFCWCLKGFPSSVVRSLAALLIMAVFGLVVYGFYMFIAKQP